MTAETTGSNPDSREGMDLNRLYEILEDATVMLRKGDEVEERRVGNVQVTDVYAMPHESEADQKLEKVDVVFVTIGVDKQKAEARRNELVDILSKYPQPDRLAGGPSYIEVGAVIGDQGAAFRLFALGKVLGMWDVITPETLGVTGPAARELAGSGMVMMSGYEPKAN